MKSAFYILVVKTVLIIQSVSQELELCEFPEKYSHCILQCKTKDFLQPVTFTNPRREDVGSCIPPTPCRSTFYLRYGLSQTRLGNENITKFYILKLNRSIEEGQWTCSYGNRPSPMKYLTVHSRPEHVNIDVEEDKDNITVKCSCYCAHPSESISMKIEISNKEKSFSRPLYPLRSTNVTKRICDNTEISVNGSIKLQKTKWPGNYVDINCLCKEKKLDNEKKSHKRYMFSGVPKKPYNVKVHNKTSNSAIISWKKTINGESRQTFVILYEDRSTNITLNKTLEEERNRESYNMTMDNLKPNTTYQVRIFAYNENGKSSTVGPLIFTTLQTDNAVEFFCQLH